MTAHERLRAARQAIDDGRYEEALADLVWFHHHALAEQRSLYGVRLSYAIAFWLDLGKVYPPALDALTGLREQKAQTLLRGEGDTALFHDLSAIDDMMGRQRATYAFYVMLAERQPELAARCADLALPAIVEAGDHRLADRVRTDPQVRLDDAMHGMLVYVRWAKRHPYTDAPHRRAMVHDHAALVRRHAEITAGAGRRDEATRFVAMAIERLQDPSLRAAVHAEIARPSQFVPGSGRSQHRRAKARRREARHRRRA